MLMSVWGFSDCSLPCLFGIVLQALSTISLKSCCCLFPSVSFWYFSPLFAGWESAWCDTFCCFPLTGDSDHCNFTPPHKTPSLKVFSPEAESLMCVVQQFPCASSSPEYRCAFWGLERGEDHEWFRWKTEILCYSQNHNPHWMGYYRTHSMGSTTHSKGSIITHWVTTTLNPQMNTSKQISKYQYC